MLSRRLLRVKAIKALYAYVQSADDNLDAAAKALGTATDKTYELYVHLLALLPQIVRYAEHRQEVARNKKLPTYEDLNPNRKFVENAAAAILGQSTVIEQSAAGKAPFWSSKPELIKNIFNQLAEADFYKAYMQNPGRSFKEDTKLLADICSEILENDSMLEDIVEEQSVYWSDDISFALMLVMRTLAAMKEHDSDVRLLPKYKNSDDAEFARRLFVQAALQFEANRRLIDKLTSNWDIERIAFMDIVIMAVAITEFKEFQSIPVKVTLDEYIEISKFYSTPNSSVFINGILDKAAEQLAASGEMVKTGRGLLGSI